MSQIGKRAAVPRMTSPSPAYQDRWLASRRPADGDWRLLLAACVHQKAVSLYQDAVHRSIYACRCFLRPVQDPWTLAPSSSLQVSEKEASASGASGSAQGHLFLGGLRGTGHTKEGPVSGYLDGLPFERRLASSGAQLVQRPLYPSKSADRRIRNTAKVAVPNPRHRLVSHGSIDVLALLAEVSCRRTRVLWLNVESQR